MLSRFPVVNRAALMVDEQTLPSFPYMSIALLACSVLRVLSAHQNKHQDNTRQWFSKTAMHIKRRSDKSVL